MTIPNAQQRIEAAIGSLVVQNADLAARVEMLTVQLDEAHAKLAEKKTEETA